MDVLATFHHLTHLVLLENPVARKEVRSSKLQERMAHTVADGLIELPVLGDLEMSDYQVLRLQEG